MATRRRPTQKMATDALYNWRVPLGVAIPLFLRAFRRSNDATKGFVLHFAGVLRSAGEEHHALAVWADDGGPVFGR